MKHLAFSLLLSAAAIGFATSTYAADLIIDEPAEVGVVDVSGSWDGPYVGVFGGYGAGTYEEPVGFTDDFDGWLLGVNAGANFSVTDGIVAGIVGDIAWTDMSFTAGGTFSVDWTASLRGRLGFDGGAFLPYLTAGLAVAGATIEDGPSDSNTHLGWTVGAGLEFAATDNLSVDLLYRYSDYGDENYFDTFDAGFNTHQITVGLNWSF
jgi:outer membrane immunogenic protein